MLETRLIEVSADRLDQYGIDWGALTPVRGGVRYEKNPLEQSFALENWVQLPMDFNLALDMLVSDGDARVLMDSKLTTTNNREASLHIGEIIPYTIQSYNLSSAGGVNQQIQKEEVGVKVDVTPHVNEDNQITLTLQPEVSSITGWKGPSSDIPLVRVRTTRTTVRVRNGQTIFLAGLLSEDKAEEIRKLPILGDIPLLGLLFQHRKTVRRKTNLVIEITPKIVLDTDELSYGIESDERGTSKRAATNEANPHKADAVETLFGSPDSSRGQTR
jgi:type II secretory pathway component GspD/PulD (secretin)